MNNDRALIEAAIAKSKAEAEAETEASSDTEWSPSREEMEEIEKSFNATVSTDEEGTVTLGIE